MIFNHNDKLSKDGIYIGIDISKWNEQVDLQLAIQEIDYVIIRCGYTSSTDGTKTIEDPYFKKILDNVKNYQFLMVFTIIHLPVIIIKLKKKHFL